MHRDLILGTAGHIDHGKTALIHALTGTDCDCLPEEKSRGITIDIGFALLEFDDYRLGIIDVPGHERFIRNMLAGATGIDVALLIVAADDSIMPQTREHLALLCLLGVQQGVIAITKTDLVDETTREVVALEIHELVQGTFLENAMIVNTSAMTGTGITELKSALAIAAERVSIVKVDESFRLAVDRVFTVSGHGTIVTGTVMSGQIRVGDTLDWHRSDGSVESVRVRGLNNHDCTVDEVHRGQRAAINLAGVPHDQVRRGQELATPGYLQPSRILTVQLSACHDSHAIKHRLPVRVHIGTSEVMGTVSLLENDEIKPGKTDFVQLFLHESVTAVWGQPVILRNSSAESTLGGGPVLQPNAGKLHRRDGKALDRLVGLGSSDETVRVAAAAWFSGFDGIEAENLVRTSGVTRSRVVDVVPPLGKGGDKSKTILDQLIVAGTLVPLMRHVHVDRLAEIGDRILALMTTLHAEHPLMTSHDCAQTLSRLEYIDASILHAVVDRLLKAKRLVGDARRIARADFQPKLTANQRKLKDRIVKAHRVAGLTPPEPASFANQAAGNAAALQDIYDVAVAEGFLVKISEEIYLLPEVESQMRKTVIARLDISPATVAEIRDILGTTRKYAVPICEYLDAIGVTLRRGDVRIAVDKRA